MQRNQQELFNINERIRSKNVRLVGDNITTGVYTKEEALRIAFNLGVDLVEISGKTDPPICKAIDYKKFLYDNKKKQKEIKKNQEKSELKEVRFSPHTEEHDFNFKTKNAIEFLKDGDKVKASVFFKGRSIMFKEQGELILLRFAQALEEFGKVEILPKLEGKRMFMTIAPKKK